MSLKLIVWKKLWMQSNVERIWNIFGLVSVVTLPTTIVFAFTATNIQVTAILFTWNVTEIQNFECLFYLDQWNFIF